MCSTKVAPPRLRRTSNLLKDSSMQKYHQSRITLRSLLQGSFHDIKDRHVFSHYNADRIINYFDGTVSLVSVFLYEELGWERALNIRQDPTPVLLSLLCFFHVMVYWINIHHCVRFSQDVMSIFQVWLLVFVSLGLVLYPLSLAAWIEKGNDDAYYIVNTAVVFILLVFNFVSDVDTGDKGANALYRVWHRAAPVFAFLYYGVACILHWKGLEGSRYMLYVAPFPFMFPLGAQKSPDENENEMVQKNIVLNAWQDIKKGNIFSPYPIDMGLDYFDTIIALATVFLFVEIFGWEDTIGGKESMNNFLVALFCFFHVMVYWIAIQHCLKFSPPLLSVLQVWFVAFLSLGFFFYPLCLTAWIEEGSIELYYIVNIYLCCLIAIFVTSTKVDEGRGNDLYRLVGRCLPFVAVTWYSIAFLLFKLDNEQRWMIIVGPFCFMFPLGGDRVANMAEERNVISGSGENPSVHDQSEDGEEFFDCSDECSNSIQ